MGLCLGIALSIISLPFIEENGSNESVHAESEKVIYINSRKMKAFNEEKNFDYGNDHEFTPILRKSVIVKEVDGSSNSKNKKVLRARYASTELGIREKIMVNVLTSPDTIGSLGVSINKTIAQYVTKLLFFMTSRPAVLPNEMSVVSFASNNNMKIYHMLKYINTHYAHNYDYYFFMPDDTFIRGKQLMDIVSKTSAAQSVHLGVPISDGNDSCSLHFGILLSNVSLFPFPNGLYYRNIIHI